LSQRPAGVFSARCDFLFNAFRFNSGHNVTTKGIVCLFHLANQPP
jgi:hypothetical protein